MVEEHAHHHDFDNPSGLTPQELAAMRWQGIQGSNSAPDIPPLAIRLCIALICHMDARTRACYVGELRLSVELGVHILSIQKAKKQLRDAGLIDWSNPGGPRHTSHYTLNWEKLLRYSREADERAKAAIENAQLTRRNHSHSAVMGMPANRSRGAVIKPFQKCSQKRSIFNSITANSNSHHSQKKSHHSRGAAPITAVGLADITLDITQKDIAQDITPSQADGGLGYTDDSEKHFVSQLAEPRRALECKKREPSKPLCFFPALVEVLGNDDAKVTAAICRLGFEQQQEASKLLKTKSSEAALAYIREHDPKGMAA